MFKSDMRHLITHIFYSYLSFNFHTIIAITPKDCAITSR